MIKLLNFDLKLIQYQVATKHYIIVNCKTAVFGKASSKSCFPIYIRFNIIKYLSVMV